MSKPYRCLSCEGKGVEKGQLLGSKSCTNCSGQGFVSDRQYICVFCKRDGCDFCDKRGILTTNPLECPRCSGVGEVSGMFSSSICPLCNGWGKLLEAVTKCSFCNATGSRWKLFGCEHCSSIGYVRGYPCPACKPSKSQVADCVICNGIGHLDTPRRLCRKCAGEGTTPRPGVVFQFVGSQETCTLCDGKRLETVQEKKAVKRPREPDVEYEAPPPKKRKKRHVTSVTQDTSDSNDDSSPPQQQQQGVRYNFR